MSVRRVTVEEAARRREILIDDVKAALRSEKNTIGLQAVIRTALYLWRASLDADDRAVDALSYYADEEACGLPIHQRRRALNALAELGVPAYGEGNGGSEQD